MARFAWVCILSSFVSLARAETPAVRQSARRVPVAANVDVLVIGGSTGAVQAALSAAEAGASVFLVAPHPYLGDDMTATLQLWLEPGEVPQSDLAKKLYDDPAAKAAKQADARTMPRPLHVKKALDDALLGAGIPFLFSCYPTEVVRDHHGGVCGVVIANRAGRQAILAKTIIDASQRATVARLVGAEFTPFPGGPQTVRYVVVGGAPRADAALAYREISPPFTAVAPKRGKSAKSAKSAKTHRVYEYTLRLPIDHDDHQTWAAAEVKARATTYHPEQQFTSDAFSFVPPNHIHGLVGGAEAGREDQSPPLEAFRVQVAENVYVLSGYADVSREAAARLARPIGLMDLGRRVGAAAAELAAAKARPTIDAVLIPDVTSARPVIAGDVSEPLQGIRPSRPWPTIDQRAGSLPVLDQYDVVVVGGGTSGAPAGIAAARRGAKTLVVEYQHALGGVGTVGAISRYYFGNIVGFSKTVAGGRAWVIEQKKEWWREQLERSGGEVWLGTIACGAVVDDHRVGGVVVATPFGRGVVLAKVVIDATGNADVAAAAGVPCDYVDQHEFAMQGTGLGSRELGGSYENTDFTWSDETDLMDIWRIYVHAKNKYPEAFDQQKLIGTRERRRVVGDFAIRVTDQLNGRTYPDSIVHASSDFDTHGYTVDPCLLVENPARRKVYSYVPYRCLLPKGFDGLLVAGLGMSVHRDAMPLVRMQPDMQNQGYAAGTAAAMAVKQSVEPRAIDVKGLQKHLVDIGNLPKSVLTDRDSYPISDERLAEAVGAFAEREDGQGASVLFSDTARAAPLVRRAFEAAEDGEAKLRLGTLLCILDDSRGLDVVMQSVAEAGEWDKGWNFMGMGQYGRPMSPLDVRIVALGMAGDRRAVPVILDKVRLLTAEHDFSHFRAVGLALEALRDPRAAEPLADVLRKPGIIGHAQTSIGRVAQLDPTREVSHGAVVSRRVSLRELALARALFRCGDHEGLGKSILEEYVSDLRGHLARHAAAVLAEEGKVGPAFGHGKAAGEP
ncbi:MAG: FAD-dependent oxidoreductase [Pirellulaceae bacterium]|nr:FAD-dependent oxidoreductase [Pirellulaceae bacterium]